MSSGLKHGSCMGDPQPGLVTTEVGPGCYHRGIDLKTKARKGYVERLKMSLFQKVDCLFQNLPAGELGAGPWADSRLTQCTESLGLFAAIEE